MRVNTTEQDFFNTNLTKSLRLVLVIDFPTPLYLVSHDDIPNIPVGSLPNTVKNVSSTSQRLNPDNGRSEIGSISLDLVDAAGVVSARFNTEQDAGEGLTGREIKLYRGGEGMDWSDFRLEQTQQISQAVSYKDGGYKIQCADIQRAMRSDIFDLAVTKLSADFDAGATTLNVFDTSDFEACSHVASFGDQPTGSYFYLKIKYENGFEIVRATGKTATSFTGVTRGVFGTTDVDHVFPTGEDDDSSVDVVEYVYLELPAPAMAYALLTGGLPGGGTIPARWNLGISTTKVDLDSFQNIGEDWFDSTDYSKGLIFRFQDVTKTDGKRFIEREVCMLAGAFMYVRADGKLYLKRMTGVLSSSDYVAELTPDNIVKHGDLKHDLSRVKNTFDIEWSWIHFPSEDKPRYVRRNILVDATSQGIHGESKTHTLRFKGLHNERHTYTTLINRFDALRDRFAGPPLTISLDLMPYMNDLEVGDICRVYLPNIKDFTTGSFLDRSMEVQRITVDQKSGRVRAYMFGSSLKAEPIADVGAGANSELPDAWYNSAGTDFATAGLSIDGSGILQANGTLTGGTTTRTIFYYLGDFTIPAATTLTISGNVELRIRGQLQINGTLRASGGLPASSSGFIGTTYGGRGRFDGKYPPYYPDLRGAPYSVRGRYEAMPILEIENNSGVLAGIPADMRGTGGGQGGPILWWNSGDVVWEQRATGGPGGAGGGSVVMVSRGAGYGVSGETNVSGLVGTQGGVTAIGPVWAAGSGGGGAPGTAVHLLDGSQVTFPILPGNIVGRYGDSPFHSTNSDGTEVGKANPNSPVDLGIAIARAQYVPKSRDPYPDYTNDDLGSSDGLSIYNAQVFIRSASAPATPTIDDGEFNFGTLTLTPPTGWSLTPPVGTDPVYVSTGQFSSTTVTGIDSTVVWTTPARLVSDGADGAAGGDGADGADGNSVFYASIFRRAAAQPAQPTGGQYDFGTKALTPPTNWFDAPPTSDGNPLWVSTGIAEAVGTTGVDSSITWTVAAELVNDGADGADGAAGSDGNSVHVSNVYRRASTAPLTPSGGQYVFDTNTLTPPSLWFAAPPAGSDPLYVSTITWSVNGTTGTDSTGSGWTAPTELVRDGTDGADGAAGADAINSRYPTIYRLNSNTISSASGTFADPLAGNPSWSYSVPTMTTDGDVVYAASRILTSDGLSPQEANWSTPAVYASRVDGVDGIQGDPGGDGADGQGVRAVNLYKLNDSTLTNNASGTFADPIAGNTDWSYSVPAIVADGDAVYVASRTFTSDAAAPQDALWSTPVIYAQRTDGIQGIPGTDGDDAVDTRYPTIYRLNSSAINSASGTFADPLAGNTSWSYNVPALAADGDIVYAASRILTSDGLSPQQANWSTPAVYAQRTDGATGGTGTPGDDGQAIRQVNIYRLNSSAISTASGTFADPLAGNASWSFSVPGLAADGDTVYTSTRTFTDDGLAPQDAAWVAATIYSQRNDGADGADGDTGPAGGDGTDGVDGETAAVAYIYQRTRDNNAPSLPSVAATYTFATGVTSALNNGWLDEIPAATSDYSYLWVTTAVARATVGTATDSIATGDWAAAVKLIDQQPGAAIVNTVDWKLTVTDPMGAWDQFGGSIGNTAVVNNIAGPYGEYPVTMRIQGDGTLPGWYSVWRHWFGYDKDKSYIFYTWVQRRSTDSNQGLYMGFYNGSAQVVNSAGTADTNPYYVSNQGSALEVGKWYLAVGVIHPDGAFPTISDTGLAGIYDPVDRARIYDGPEFGWNGQAASTSYVRHGFYENSGLAMNTDDGFYFTRNKAFVRDGSEPSIDDVLRGIPFSTRRTGSLETREDSGGVGNTTPRLLIQNAQAPLRIMDTDDATALFELTNTASGFRLGLLGDFEPNSLTTAQAFSAVGIADLRGRLGLQDPAGGTEQRGGDLTQVSTSNASNGSTHLCDRDPLNTATITTIQSLPKDITLTFKIQGYDFDDGFPGYAAGNWTIKWQRSADGGAYTDIAGASYSVIGTLEIEYEPGFTFYNYSLSEQRTYVWTGSVADVEYKFRLVCTLNSGTDIGNITVLTASEPLSAAGVIEQHVHSGADITVGTVLAARIDTAIARTASPSFTGVVTIAQDIETPAYLDIKRTVAGVGGLRFYNSANQLQGYVYHDGSQNVWPAA